MSAVEFIAWCFICVVAGGLLGWSMGRNDCNARRAALDLIQGACGRIAERQAICEDALAACVERCPDE